MASERQIVLGIENSLNTFEVIAPLPASLDGECDGRPTMFVNCLTSWQHNTT